MRALVELAERAAAQPGRPVRLSEVADSREMPVQFLEQLFAALRRVGVLRSRRGASGGYTFARPAGARSPCSTWSRRSTGSSRRPSCTQGECDRLEGCGAASVWIEAQGGGRGRAARAPRIADLLRARARACAARPPMYYI